MGDHISSSVATTTSRRRVTPSDRVKELARNRCLGIWGVDAAEFDSLVPPIKGKHLFRVMRELAEHQPDWEIVKARLKEAIKTRIATQGKRKTPGVVMCDAEEVLRRIQADRNKMVAAPSGSQTDEKIDDIDERMDDTEDQTDIDDDDDTSENVGVDIKTEDVPPRLNSIVAHMNRDLDAKAIRQCVLSIASAFPFSVCVAHSSLTDRAKTTIISPTAQTVLCPIHFGNVMNRGRWGIAVINMTCSQPITVEIYDTIATDTYPPEVRQEITESLHNLRDAAQPQLDALFANIQFRFIPCFNEYFEDPHYTALSLFTITMFLLAEEKIPAALDADAYAWLMMTMFQKEAENDLIASTLGDLLQSQPSRPEPVENDEEELARHSSWLKERAEWRAKRKEACEVADDMLRLLTTLESATTGEGSEISQLETMLSTARIMMDGEQEFGSVGDPNHGRVKQVLQGRVERLEKQLEAAKGAVQRLQTGRTAVEQLLDGNLPL